MTTVTTGDDATKNAAMTRMSENLHKVEELTERLSKVMSNRQTHQQALDGPNQELFAKAAQSYFTEAINNPAKLMEHQMGYWTQTVTHFMEAQQALAKGQFAAPQDRTGKDRRFANPLWETHPYFNFVKQQYLINAQALSQAVDDITDMAPHEKKRLAYFSRQIIDLLSPTNFLATNPDALQRAIETEGESLVKGLEKSDL
jgi:polyhydroxyalkanoate synthase